MRDWLQKLQAEVNRPAVRPRLPLYVQHMKIGSVEPVFMRHLALNCNKYGREKLLKEEQLGWCVIVGQDDVTGTLNQLAALLRDLGLAGPWRHEQLAVRNETGVQVGTIERGAVRPFGIATQAVHLVGRTPDGRHWVQQRALSKPNDPGKWDTLMGGMVSAADTMQSAVERETWEEAGLRLSQLHHLAHDGCLTVRQPAMDGNGAGYVVEDIHWYTCTVPDDVLPVNQDQEVAQFAIMNDAQLLAALRCGDFTTEAALILASVLQLQS